MPTGTVLIEISSDAGTSRLPARGTTMSIGRTADNDIVLDGEDTVSRRHAELSQTDARWELRDLGSSNGTHLNGVRLGPDETVQVDGGFLSVRTAPTTDTFALASRLYFEMNDVEQWVINNDGVNRRDAAEVGSRRLQEELEKEGIVGYRDLMYDLLPGEVAELERRSGIDIDELTDRDALSDALGNEDKTAGWGKLVDTVFSKQVEPKLIEPTFILDYPRDISPLAKTVPGDETHVERFEMFIGGMEMGNAFTELNNPVDQEARFMEMGRLYAAEDELAMPIDEDYLRAMRYGMPPSGGCGIGVDRLVMLLTDKSTIREVLLYPHLRER